jgi:hypothetical protein
MKEKVEVIEVTKSLGLRTLLADLFISEPEIVVA